LSAVAAVAGSRRATHLAARYRNAALVLGLAIVLLAGTAVWLVVQARVQVWEAARRNQEDVALAVQSSISGLLAQSSASLDGVRSDLAGAAAGSPPDREARLRILREAQRFDPISSYLGVRAGGSLLLVDAQGRARDDLAPRSLPRLDPADAREAVRFGALLQFAGDANWYLPVVIPLPHGLGADGIAYALVPTQRLLGAASSLKVLPGSLVTLFTRSGQRLIRKLIADDVLQPNGKPVPASVLAIVSAASAGNFASVSTVDGRPTLFAFSSADRLPLVVTTGVPESELQHEWLARATAPVLMLLAGLAAVVVFGLRLRGALADQRAYLATQEYLASHDQLTDLPNRYAFLQQVQRRIGGGAGQRGFCLLLLDVNRFKDVNDTLGHEAGDAVLQALGARLVDQFASDTAFVARLGGDELALCASRLDPADAAAIDALCERVHAALGAPLVSTGIELSVTASIGVATWPADAQTALELLRCADIAMYRAKQDLAATCRYTEGLDNFTSGALAMKADFAKAIRDGSLSLVYQPKLRVSDQVLVGVEALSRWNHPVKGPIAPFEFLPLAETTELIHPFTDLVLKNAVTQIATWLDAGHAVPVAVNISANNLLDPLFADKLGALLAATGVPARLLELEVTESAVMRYPETMHKRLQEIRALGVKMSIDDFGTGYASLAYLKHLPVDTLKIDKLFITHVDTDAGDRRIVRSSIQLAHGFGMSVVAEGVETQAAADVLAEEGCDFAQGYHFARPCSAAAIEADWLSRLAVETAPTA
jgi:diguanylate cyclase (GGDEF)-like protein